MTLQQQFEKLVAAYKNATGTDARQMARAEIAWFVITNADRVTVRSGR